MPQERDDSCGLLPFVLITLIIFIYDVMSSSNSIDIRGLDRELKEKVHLQTDVRDLVVQTLNRVYNREEAVTVLNFVGPCGVGKTFISNIIKTHFHSAIYDEMRGPLRGEFFVKRSTNIIRMIESEKFSNYKLIIIDDLTISDLDNLLNFTRKVPKDNSVTLLVNIFNIQETDENYLNYSIRYDYQDEIREQFDKAEIISYKTAVFHEFTPSQTKNWAEKQLISFGVNPETRSDILEAVLSHHEVNRLGLKGLESKIRDVILISKRDGDIVTFVQKLIN